MKKLLLSTFYFLLSTTTALAVSHQGTTPAGGGRGKTPDIFQLPNPLKTTSFIDIINRVINYLVIFIGPPILTIMILWGAFYILTSGGDVEKVKTGRKVILYAVIGYGLILLAGGVGALVKQLLGI